jgi:hypothetical protein
METLVTLVDDSRTDKNTRHSYLNLYQELLHKKQHTATNVLEIGIGPNWPYNGGSIKLWLDYFENADVHALDIVDDSCIHDDIKNNKRTKLFTSIDAYDESFFTNTFLNTGLKFDFMLDDGPHTLESMKTFIRLYSQIMKDDGILAIEDVQSIDWIEDLKNVVPDELKPFIKVYDLRYIKDRYDDIVFTIDKSN